MDQRSRSQLQVNCEGLQSLFELVRREIIQKPSSSFSSSWVSQSKNIFSNLEFIKLSTHWYNSKRLPQYRGRQNRTNMLLSKEDDNRIHTSAASSTGSSASASAAFFFFFFFFGDSAVSTSICSTSAVRSAWLSPSASSAAFFFFFFFFFSDEGVSGVASSIVAQK